HQLWELANNFRKVKKIYTNRHKDEAGNPEFGYQYDENERLGILRGIAVTHHPDYIDIEHKHTKRGFRPFQKIGKTKIIVSYHDFQKTPDYDGLRRIYDEIAGRADCDIVKIATMVNEEKDNENIFRLVQHAHAGGGSKPIVAIGMGELGAVTRYKGPELGSLWTFGALCEKRKSALGQKSIEDLRHYFKTGEMR
ncbi:MAG: type I 3-dehydroquinate dehydratase, partial [Nanoarchaeota archaeon]